MRSGCRGLFVENLFYECPRADIQAGIKSVECPLEEPGIKNANGSMVAWNYQKPSHRNCAGFKLFVDADSSKQESAEELDEFSKHT